MKGKRQIYKKCLKLAKDIAKIRDKYTCQRCWAKTNIHWSHIINEARDHRLAINPDNIKALCYNCHLGRRHKDPIMASEWFNEKFPWRYDKLRKLHIEYQKLWNISLSWYEEQLSILTERHKSLLKLQNKSV